MSINKMETEKLEPDDYKYWLNLNIFIRTATVCSFVFALLLLWVEQSRPPDGYVFERLPPIVGEWSKASGSLRATSNKVSGLNIICSFPTVVYFGASGSCDFAKIPVRTVVTVTEVRIPVLGGSSTFVQSIKANGIVYLEIADFDIRRRWVNSATTEAGSLAIHLLIAAYISQILMLRKYFKK